GTHDGDRREPNRRSAAGGRGGRPKRAADHVVAGRSVETRGGGEAPLAADQDPYAHAGRIDQHHLADGLVLYVHAFMATAYHAYIGVLDRRWDQAEHALGNPL